MMFHYTFRGYAADGLSQLSFPSMREIFKYGYLGIYFFIILSGYTILITIRGKSFKKFISKKFIRLYPPLFCAIIITTFFSFFSDADRYDISMIQFIANLSLVNGLFGIPYIDGVYWFIHVLIQFYIGFAILHYFGLVKYLKIILSSWLLLSLALHFKNIPVIDDVIMYRYASFFVAGIIIGISRDEGWDKINFSIFLFSVAVSLISIKYYIPVFEKYYSTKLSYLINYLIIIFIHGTIFLIGTIKNNTNHNYFIITLLSASTYPLYLLHQNIGFILFHLFDFLDNKYLILIFTINIVLIISIFITKQLDPYLGKKIMKIF